MRARPGWLRVRRERDFDREGRDWLRRLCGPKGRAWRLPSLHWPKLGRLIQARKLVAFSAISTAAVALFSPSLPFLAPLFVPPLAAAGQITGYARVIDGDTIQVDETRIRLFGIDAPEKHQSCRREVGPLNVPYPCGGAATAALVRIIGSGAVVCDPRDHDRYGRTVAVCDAHGADIGREMVRQGWAVAYTRYSSAYVGDEGIARGAKRALWAGEFENPEHWRHSHPRE
jgi:endonuclease YncB( thermonuclease family)